MTLVVQIIISSVVALLGAFAGAQLAYHNMSRIEDQKLVRRRMAIGTVIQAELAHLHHELSDHHRRLDGYRKRTANTVGATTKTDFPKLEIGDGLASVYRSTLSEIGLFDTETSYGVVYCYSNTFKFLRDRETLFADLDNLLNSSTLGHRVQNLYDREAALLQQIERIMPRLAQQSSAIPFTHSAYN